MHFDLIFLSRLQFALTIMFHYIFPPLTIGLGGLLVIMEGAYLRTGNKLYETMARFWTKIFAINFAMGVATGIVMEFQFGTNWASYSRFVGDVFGSALAAEGIFAFFLESGFLAVLVFGWDKVSPRMHFFSTVMVALGAFFSSIWIVVANSWQQTPAGFHIVGEGEAARAEITNFWEMVFNPSSVERLLHVLLGSYILSAFFVMSICAYYLLRGRHLEFARKCFSIALIVGTIACYSILLSGHSQAVTVSKTQPAKLAALEGVFKTQTAAPLYIFGLPDVTYERVRFGLSIRMLLSFLLSGNPHSEVIGLDRFAPQDRPPVVMTFLSYHLMVALGMFFIALSTLACIQLYRGRLFETRWLLWIFVPTVIGPYLANHSGWAAAEIGRQPWVVYNLLRTSDAISKAVDASQVIFSIVMFGIIYLLLFALWIYVMNMKIQQGPAAELVPIDGQGRKGFFATASKARESSSLTSVES